MALYAFCERTCVPNTHEAIVKDDSYESIKSTHLNHGGPFVLVSVDDVLHLRLKLVGDAQLVVDHHVPEVFDTFRWGSTQRVAKSCI